MIKQIILLSLMPLIIGAQDLAEGLNINDLELHPMQEIAKPSYLDTITDPSFGTTIRRISDAGAGGVIVPMYSTIQAWNSDESYMILYNQSESRHELLNGRTYESIRTLEDIRPDDLEQIFWDFDDPDIFYYPDNLTKDFIKYSISNQSKEILMNMVEASNCDGGISMGNDVQMMSWDSDIFTFRCQNSSAFRYQISTGELTTFDLENVNYIAPGVAPSGNRFYHRSSVYNKLDSSVLDLNVNSTEHSCLGKLPNGNDAYYAIAFAEGPEGGCIGDIIAHDLTTGECISVISQGQGYDYPQSGTHISALAHKNTEGGWIAASMVGYDRDGQELLDQELVIAKVENENIKVCRIGHHRSDEDQFDYWGEPHAVISPSGTRVLFASDWSGEEDGESVDSYVVELPSYSSGTVTISELKSSPNEYKLFPNPVVDYATIELNNPSHARIEITVFNSSGNTMIQDATTSESYKINASQLSKGFYFFGVKSEEGISIMGKFLKK